MERAPVRGGGRPTPRPAVRREPPLVEENRTSEQLWREKRHQPLPLHLSCWCSCTNTVSPRLRTAPDTHETESHSGAGRFQKYFIFWTSHNESAPTGGPLADGEAEAMRGQTGLRDRRTAGLRSVYKMGWGGGCTAQAHTHRDVRAPHPHPTPQGPPRAPLRPLGFSTELRKPSPRVLGNKAAVTRDAA